MLLAIPISNHEKWKFQAPEYQAEPFESRLIVFGWLALLLGLFFSARCRPSPAIAPTSKIRRAFGPGRVRSSAWFGC